MLTVVQTSYEAFEVAKELKETKGLQGFEIGITGAFADGSNKKASPIQIVLKAQPGNEKAVGSFEVLDRIQSFMSVHYYNKYEVIWLDLLSVDEERLLKFNADKGIEPQPASIYTRVVETAKWVKDGSDVDSEAEASREYETEGAY